MKQLKNIRKEEIGPLKEVNTCHHLVSMHRVLLCEEADKMSVFDR